MTLSIADCLRISLHSIAQRICHTAARRGVPLQDVIDHAPLLGKQRAWPELLRSGNLSLFNICVVSRYIGCDMRDILPEAPGSTTPSNA